MRFHNDKCFESACLSTNSSNLLYLCQTIGHVVSDNDTYLLIRFVNNYQVYKKRLCLCFSLESHYWSLISIGESYRVQVYINKVNLNPRTVDCQCVKIYIILWVYHRSTAELLNIVFWHLLTIFGRHRPHCYRRFSHRFAKPINFTEEINLLICSVLGGDFGPLAKI